MKRVKYCRLFRLWHRPLGELYQMKYGLISALYTKAPHCSGITHTNALKPCEKCAINKYTPSQLCKHSIEWRDEQTKRRHALQRVQEKGTGRKTKHYEGIEMDIAYKYPAYKRLPFCRLFKLRNTPHYKILEAVVGLQASIRGSVATLCSSKGCEFCWFRPALPTAEMYKLAKLQEVRIKNIVRNYEAQRHSHNVK